MMKHLIIDIGNTLAKIAIFDEEKNLVLLDKIKTENSEDFLKPIENKNIQKAIISDVSA